MLAVFFSMLQITSKSPCVRGGAAAGGRDSPFRRLLSGFRNFVHIVAVGKDAGWQERRVDF